MIEILQALVFGACFGFVLHRAGLTAYARIVDVYRFRDLTVLKFMLSAIVTGAVLVETARALGLVDAVPVPASSLLANLVGGLVFGVGMALAGYCPGTIVAEAGEGRLDAVGPGLLGLMVGAMVFGLLEPSIMPALTRTSALGHVTFSALLGVHPLLLALVVAEAVLIVFVLVERAPDES